MRILKGYDKSQMKFENSQARCEFSNEMKILKHDMRILIWKYNSQMKWDFSNGMRLFKWIENQTNQEFSETIGI